MRKLQICAPFRSLKTLALPAGTQNRQNVARCEQLGNGIINPGGAVIVDGDS
jgi:hypothetical protein